MNKRDREEAEMYRRYSIAHTQSAIRICAMAIGDIRYREDAILHVHQALSDSKMALQIEGVMSGRLQPHPRYSDQYIYREYHICPSNKPFGIRGFDWQHDGWDLGDHRHGWSATVEQACADIDEQIEEMEP